MDVRWHPAADADAALRSHVAAVAEVEPSAVRVGRLCPSCGSAEHGRPWAEALPGGPVHVSTARSSPHLVTVVASAPVGIDVESVARVDAAWPDLGLVTDAQSPAERAQWWCRLEAVGKLTGVGLTGPPGQIRLAEHDVRDLPAPEGYAAAVALHRVVL